MRMSRRVRGVAALILLLAVTARSSGQPDPAAERARRLNEAVGLLDAGLPGDAQSAIEPVLAEARAAGDKSTEGHALGQLARALQALGDAAGADARFEEAEIVLTEVGDPYTLGLLRSIPRLDLGRQKRLIPIDGLPPDLLEAPMHCPFAPRCSFAVDKCWQENPPLVEVAPNHKAACWVDISGVKVLQVIESDKVVE